MRSQEVEETKEGMELQVSCRDVGVDCDYVAHGRAEEELFKMLQSMERLSIKWNRFLLRS